MNQAADIQQLLEKSAVRVDAALNRCAWRTGDAPANLVQAMEYALFAGGKRLRPALVVLACEACGGKEADAMPFACAIEMVHTYSLIHDDLPCMDDDDLRRGKPTCHKVYGEATATLAGDALQTEAFLILARDIPDAARSQALIRVLAECGGVCGMVGGQQDDLDAEGALGETAHARPSSDKLASIHRRKTGALFSAAAAGGAIAAGATNNVVDAFRNYGMALGLVFQAADDVLDVTSTREAMGKSAGKDARQGKLTYPALFGLEKAKEQVDALADAARAAGAQLPRAPVFCALADVAARRTR